MQAFILTKAIRILENCGPATALNLNPAFTISPRPKITHVTVAAYPDRRSFGNFTFCGFQPFIKLDGASTDISLCGARHLQTLLLLQDSGTLIVFGLRNLHYTKLSLE